MKSLIIIIMSKFCYITKNRIPQTVLLVFFKPTLFYQVSIIESKPKIDISNTKKYMQLNCYLQYFS